MTIIRQNEVRCRLRWDPPGATWRAELLVHLIEARSPAPVEQGTQIPAWNFVIGACSWHGARLKKGVVAISPEKHPDAGPVDQEYLLNELARLRELVFKIPPHKDTIAQTNIALQAIRKLEQQLRNLLLPNRRPDPKQAAR